MQVYAGSGAPMLKWHGMGVAADAVAKNVAAKETSGLVTFVLSTDDVDRHGDVVSADGWRVEAYLRNPVLLWAHDYRRPAIGRAVAVWAEPHRLLAKMEFAPGAFAQEVAALYEYGFQWGVSVGFRPIRWEERRDSHNGKFLGLRYLEQELLEVSAVPVPANRNALRRDTDASDRPPGSGLAAATPANASDAGIGVGAAATRPVIPAASSVIPPATPASSPVIPAKAGIHWETIALGALLAELEAGKV